MSRPKSWYPKKEYNQAKSVARRLGYRVWSYTRNTRKGPEHGYFIGNAIPIRLKHAKMDLKATFEYKSR